MERFKTAFVEADRAANFSSEGLKALCDYLEAVNGDSGTDYHIDVMALCSEWSEYGSAAVLCRDLYGIDTDEKTAIDFLCSSTVVIKLSNSIIINNF